MPELRGSHFDRAGDILAIAGIRYELPNQVAAIHEAVCRALGFIADILNPGGVEQIAEGRDVLLERPRQSDFDEKEPRRNAGLVDPHFGFAVDLAGDPFQPVEPSLTAFALHGSALQNQAAAETIKTVFFASGPLGVRHSF